MLPESDEEASNMLAVSLISVVIITIACILLVLLLKGSLLSILDARELGSYVWLIPVSVFPYGIGHALGFWNSRTRHFGRLSANRILNAALVSMIKLAAGYTGHATGGTLIGAGVVGSWASTALLAGRIWGDDRQLFLRSISWRSMWHGISIYRKFPLLDIWTGLLNAISWQLPALMLSSYFSSTTVGYYSVSFRLLSLPMSLIGASIGQVFFQRAAVANSGGDLAQVVEKTFQRLVAVSLFPLVMLAIIGRDLSIFALGARWAEAGVYTQILSVWTFFWFISSPISTVFSLLQRQELGIAVQIAILATRLLALVIGGFMGNVYLALGLFAASGVVVYAGLTIWSMVLAGSSVRLFFDTIMRFTCMSLPLLIVLPALKILGSPPWLVSVAGAVTLAGCYALALITNPGLRMNLAPWLRRSKE